MSSADVVPMDRQTVTCVPHARGTCTCTCTCTHAHAHTHTRTHARTHAHIRIGHISCHICHVLSRFGHVSILSFFISFHTRCRVWAPFLDVQCCVVTLSHQYLGGLTIRVIKYAAQKKASLVNGPENWCDNVTPRLLLGKSGRRKTRSCLCNTRITRIMSSHVGVTKCDKIV